ncbi:transcription elongation factor NusA-like protein [Cuniculiplasma divulgatum]|uniref:Transcription elongation factor NusA-like protein n=1 Tax=Cuniculiplasma divulgatum TaxID=1673428 RepID=A0A1N5VUF5_9ARCH|nr:transcription elongation factor NusA-like protein [Cuniculiplasma divulgatum]EQB68237.1 MAG: transcription elongation factor NusA-like protein [Thermoplasmatales archaeon Gpl]MCI2412634.1 NusA-like transcription termination signal-binding factor [Cuniculiplasma sp.]MCL4320768.1 NusA-like transcription termination signal-binding factor [Candidatus Thermoplasmatota archaeon]WMT49647.1 MAG: NusA-like transcription termination signal-binding factor [Thermoplasmatales archaeon]MCL6014296.1 NusA-
MASKGIVIDNRIMEYRALFEKVARGVQPEECMENEDMVVFIVGERRMAEMFKRNQNVIQNLREKINKHILVAEYSKDLLTFIKNLYFRYGVKEIDISWKQGQVDVQVGVELSEVGKAIGKEGRNVKLMKEVASRFYEIRNFGIKQPA